MATTAKTGYEPAEIDFVVTYVTKHATVPISYQVLSLREFRRILRTKNRAITENLPELSPHNTTPEEFEEHLQRQQHLEDTFPYVGAGIGYIPHFEAEQLRVRAGGRERPELVILSFEYTAVQANEARTAANRERLQKRLLADPLLGPSIMLIYKGPGECVLHVLVAASYPRGYWTCVNTISAYLNSACCKLRAYLQRADGYVRTPRFVGYDPLAWLRPRPAADYPLFPVRLAQRKIAECA